MVSNIMKTFFVILGIILIVGAVSGLFFLTRDITPQGETQGNQLEIESAVTQDILDFCTTEEECTSFLREQGMPDSFLEDNNLEINCINDICTIG